MYKCLQKQSWIQVFSLLKVCCEAVYSLKSDKGCVFLKAKTSFGFSHLIC